MEKSVFEEIKTKCEKLGISLSKLCRDASVDRSILERWKLSNPKSIETLNKLNEQLKKIEDEQNNNNG